MFRVSYAVWGRGIKVSFHFREWRWYVEYFNTVITSYSGYYIHQWLYFFQVIGHMVLISVSCLVREHNYLLLKQMKIYSVDMPRLTQPT